MENLVTRNVHVKLVMFQLIEIIDESAIIYKISDYRFQFS